MDTPAEAVENREPTPLAVYAELAKLREEHRKLTEAASVLALKYRQANAAGESMGEAFTKAIRIAWPRLTDAEKAPLLEFWKRLGHKDQPGPMSGLVLVGG